MLQTLGLAELFAQKAVVLIRLMTGHQGWSVVFDLNDAAVYWILQGWLKDPEVQRFLQINRYPGILWYNQEAFDEFLWWMLVSEVISTCTGQKTPEKVAKQIVALFNVVQKLQTAEKSSNYQVDRLLSAVTGPA